MRKLKYLIALLFLCTQTRAQHPYFYPINDENGLPSNEVYQVIQDREGYMWIGCDAGLFRYDGFEYRQYKSSRQTGRSISGLNIDLKGRIWCRNFNGQVLHTEGDSLVLVADQSKSVSGNSNYTLDGNNNIWMLKNN